MDTKARPSRPRGNDDDEVIVVDTITEPADDADAAWPESPGLDVEEEPREYTFEVAVEGEEAEEDHAEKEKKDDGENGDNKEEDQVQEAVEQQVEDTEEGGDVGEDEKKEADHMMEADIVMMKGVQSGPCGRSKQKHRSEILSGILIRRVCFKCASLV